MITETVGSTQEASSVQRMIRRWAFIPHESLRVEWDGDYGCEHRSGWSVAVDGAFLVQLERFLLVAILKAWWRRARNWDDDSIAPNDKLSGSRAGSDAYELDVAEAQKAYNANPSSMNHEDLYAAKCALRRHWPNAAAERQPGTEN